MRPKARQIAPLVAASALVLCLYSLRAKQEAEERQAARPISAETGDGVAHDAMPYPEEMAGLEEDMIQEGDVVLDETIAEEAQMAATLEYLDAIRRIPGAAPLLDDVIEYLDKGDGLPVDDDGMITLDDPMNEKLIKNPEVKAKWEKLMALIAQNPPPKVQLRN